MPATFEKLGVAFEYPENWELEEEDAHEGGWTVTLYTPGGGFWSLQFESYQIDQAQLAAEALEVMRKEYVEVDVQSVSETVEDTQLVGVDISFYCLDLTNTARLRTLQTGRGTWMILCQAEDREFEKIEPVFRAITTSLLRGL